MLSTDGSRSGSQVEMSAEVILELLSDQDVKFAKGETILPAAQALVSRPLTTALTKLGFFSSNLHTIAPGNPGGIPALLVAISFDYAVSVSPLIGGDDPRFANAIDVDGVLAHVARIERVLGPIDVDPQLAHRLSRLSEIRLSQPSAADRRVRA